MMTFLSDPTTAKGIIAFCNFSSVFRHSQRTDRGDEVVTDGEVGRKGRTYSDSFVELSFFFVVLLIVERVRSNIVMSEFSTNLHHRHHQ